MLVDSGRPPTYINKWLVIKTKENKLNNKLVFQRMNYKQWRPLFQARKPTDNLGAKWIFPPRRYVKFPRSP